MSNGAVQTQRPIKEIFAEMYAKQAAEARAELGCDHTRKDYYVALFVPDERYHPVLACVTARFDAVTMRAWYGLVHCERFERGAAVAVMADRAAKLWRYGRIQQAYCSQMLVEVSHGGMALEEAIRARDIPASFWQVGAGETSGTTRTLSLTDLRATSRTLGEERRMRVRDNLPDFAAYMDEIRKLRLGTDVGDWQKHSRAVAASLACWLGEWFKYAAWVHVAHTLGGQVQ